jgi:hypothetical protein
VLKPMRSPFSLVPKPCSSTHKAVQSVKHKHGEIGALTTVAGVVADRESSNGWAG